MRFSFKLSIPKDENDLLKRRDLEYIEGVELPNINNAVMGRHQWEGYILFHTEKIYIYLPNIIKGMGYRNLPLIDDVIIKIVSYCIEHEYLHHILMNFNIRPNLQDKIISKIMEDIIITNG